LKEHPETRDKIAELVIAKLGFKRPAAYPAQNEIKENNSKQK